MKLHTTLLIMLLTTNLFAQKYHSLLNPANTWTIGYFDYNALPPEAWSIQYSYQGDTIINDKVYKNFGHQALLREDTIGMKVYRFYSGHQNEILLFDFQAQKNDTFTDGSLTYVIDSISMIQLNTGENRRAFYYSGGLGIDYFIEGIGSIVGFVECSEGNGPPSVNLSCFTQNGISLYGCNSLSVEGVNVKSKILIYPMPVINKFTIESKLNINRISIIDLNGTVVYEQYLNSNECSIENLESGIYIVNLYHFNKLIDRQKIIKTT